MEVLPHDGSFVGEVRNFKIPRFQNFVIAPYHNPSPCVKNRSSKSLAEVISQTTLRMTPDKEEKLRVCSTERHHCRLRQTKRGEQHHSITTFARSGPRSGDPPGPSNSRSFVHCTHGGPGDENVFGSPVPSLLDVEVPEEKTAYCGRRSRLFGLSRGGKNSWHPHWGKPMSFETTGGAMAEVHREGGKGTGAETGRSPISCDRCPTTTRGERTGKEGR